MDRGTRKLITAAVKNHAKQYRIEEENKLIQSIADALDADDMRQAEKEFCSVPIEEDSRVAKA